MAFGTIAFISQDIEYGSYVAVVQDYAEAALAVLCTVLVTLQ